MLLGQAEKPDTNIATQKLYTMATLTVYLSPTGDDEDDRIAKRIIRQNIGKKMYLLHTCDSCSAIHVTIPNLARHEIVPTGIRIQAEMLRQNIEVGMAMDDDHTNPVELIAN